MSNELDAAISQAARELGLGATGQFPQGTIGPHDEGELKCAVSFQHGKLVINFGKSLSWIAMTEEQGIQFALMVLAKCGVQVQQMPSRKG